MKVKLLLLILVLSHVSVSATIRYVTPSGAGSMDGSDWTNAAPGDALQSMITASIVGDEVWVACGSYFPTTTTNRNSSFSMRHGVAIYGGFAGTETQLSERTLSCGPCSILSGEIGVAGTFDNSYTVVYNQLLDSTAILDGFTVRDGNDDRSPSSNGNGLGGGVYNHGYGSAGHCDPTIRNCVFTNNFASWGAGAFNNGYANGDSEPFYFNCIFHQNHAYIEAGGMDSYGVGGNASPTVVNTIFYENTSATNAGAMYAWGGNAGGNSHPVLINCLFVNNAATNGYGGAFVARDLDENGSTTSGSCTVTLQNCVMWNNTATGVSPQFYALGSGAQIIASYSDIDLSGQVAPHIISGPGTGNLDTDPQFMDISNAIGVDGCWLTADDGLQTQSASPLVNAGLATAAPDVDVLGISRFGDPDIGVYEDHSQTVSLDLNVLLEGPFNATNLSMDDGLRSNILVPGTEPYLDLGFSNIYSCGCAPVGMSVLSVVGNDAIVDWVLIELRSSADPATIVTAVPAFVQRDGDVVDRDGVSLLSVEATTDDYYVAIRHRNHLGVMSAQTLSLSNTPTIYDFSDQTTLTWGTDAQSAQASLNMMWMGNVVNDGDLKYTGLDNDRDPILVDIGGSVPTATAVGYMSSDTNMDGTVKYIGSDNDRDPILVNVGGSVPTTTRTEQLP